MPEVNFYRNPKELRQYLQLDWCLDSPDKSPVEAREEMIKQALAEVSVDALLHDGVVSDLRHLRVQGGKSEERICLTKKSRSLTREEAQTHVDIIAQMAVRELSASGSPKKQPEEAYFCNILMHCAYHENEEVRSAALSAIAKLYRDNFIDAFGIEAVAVLISHREQDSDAHPPVVKTIIRKVLARPDLVRLIEDNHDGKNHLAYCREMVKDWENSVDDKMSLQEKSSQDCFLGYSVSNFDDFLSEVSINEQYMLKNQQEEPDEIWGIPSFPIYSLNEYKQIPIATNKLCKYAGAFAINTASDGWKSKLYEILSTSRLEEENGKIKILDIYDVSSKKYFHVLTQKFDDKKESIIIDPCPMHGQDVIGDTTLHEIGKEIGKYYAEQKYNKCDIVNYASNEYCRPDVGGGWALCVNYLDIHNGKEGERTTLAMGSLVDRDNPVWLKPRMNPGSGYLGISLLKCLVEIEKREGMDLKAIVSNFIFVWEDFNVETRQEFLVQLKGRIFDRVEYCQHSNSSLV